MQIYWRAAPKRNDWHRTSGPWPHGCCVWQTRASNSQLLPSKPGAHWHWYQASVGIHWPPLRHGWEAQRLSNGPNSVLNKDKIR
jgi:hypothetical protein